MHRDHDECIGIQRKNGIDGLLAIFDGAHNLELSPSVGEPREPPLMIKSERTR